MDANHGNCNLPSRCFHGSLRFLCFHAQSHLCPSASSRTRCSGDACCAVSPTSSPPLGVMMALMGLGIFAVAQTSHLNHKSNGLTEGKKAGLAEALRSRLLLAFGGVTLCLIELDCFLHPILKELRSNVFLSHDLGMSHLLTARLEESLPRRD